jgi:hypothetical protein
MDPRQPALFLEYVPLHAKLVEATGRNQKIPYLSPQRGQMVTLARHGSGFRVNQLHGRCIIPCLHERGILSCAWNLMKIKLVMPESREAGIPECVFDSPVFSSLGNEIS